MVLKQKKLKKGFTLVELLVTIAIFSIITVLMSNIVISMAKFSLQSERRSDLITEIDNAANVIKNDLRGANEIGVCTFSNKKYIYKKNGENYSKLDILQNKLSWVKLDSLSSCSGTMEEKVLTSSQLLLVKNLEISYSLDSVDINDSNLNTLIYVHAEIYDSAKNEKIFDPEKNPYSYVFSISTRKINVI